MKLSKLFASSIVAAIAFSLLMAPAAEAATSASATLPVSTSQTSLSERFYLMGDGNELQYSVKPVGQAQVTRIGASVSARYRLKLIDVSSKKVLLSREAGYWRATYATKQILQHVGADSDTTRSVLRYAKAALKKSAAQVKPVVTKFVVKARHAQLKYDLSELVTFVSLQVLKTGHTAGYTLPSSKNKPAYFFGYTPQFTITEQPGTAEYVNFTVVATEAHDGYSLGFNSDTNKFTELPTRR